MDILIRAIGETRWTAIKRCLRAWHEIREHTPLDEYERQMMDLRMSSHHYKNHGNTPIVEKSSPTPLVRWEPCR